MVMLNNLIVILLVYVPWIMGVVLAAGKLKIVATVIAPYAWYLTIKMLMEVLNLI